ncbi:hypothetical protein PMAYCL1PPCAC_06764, partial [Pristionchus mayeri]
SGAVEAEVFGVGLGIGSSILSIDSIVSGVSILSIRSIGTRGAGGTSQTRLAAAARSLLLGGGCVHGLVVSGYNEGGRDDGSGVSVSSLSLGDQLSSHSLDLLHTLVLIPETRSTVLAEVNLSLEGRLHVLHVVV